MTETTTPERDVKIVESKTVRSAIPGTGGKLGPEKPHDDKIHGPRFSVYVDGAYHGSCRTREKAEKMAEMERNAEETVTERAIRILQAADLGDQINTISMWHTGGGCLAAGISLKGDDRGYVMVTDEEMGYDTRPDGGYLVGVYPFDGDDTGVEWDEDRSGEVRSDEDLIVKVRKGVDFLTN
jgi:hypothetical protein